MIDHLDMMLIRRIAAQQPCVPDPNYRPPKKVMREKREQADSTRKMIDETIDAWFAEEDCQK